jgi:molecular chaperone DnaK
LEFFNRFITEPSAAAIAYGFDHQKFDGYRLLVYDFGGGTFDVTIIQANKGEFTQLATLGDDIGGRDIDKLLFDVKHFLILY